MDIQTFGEYWHPVALPEEVTTEPRVFELLGEQMVLYRHDDGIAALTDRCSHRGTPLSLGCARDGRAVCAYHGWEFDSDGTCVHIPSLPEGGRIPSKTAVTSFRAEERHDVIWVALRASSQEIPPWPDDDWNRPDLHVFLVGTWSWDASAGRMIENAMDFSHFNFVHQGYTELADGPVVKPFGVERTEDGIAYSYDDTALVRSYRLHAPFALHDKKLVVAEAGGVTWSETAKTTPGDTTTISFVASPIDAGHTRIFVWLSRNHSLDVPDADFTTGFDDLMNQDQVIVEAQRPIALPLDLRDEIHLRCPDAPSLAYRTLMAEITNNAGATGAS